MSGTMHSGRGCGRVLQMAAGRLALICRVPPLCGMHCLRNMLGVWAIWHVLLALPEPGSRGVSTWDTALLTCNSLKTCGYQ